MENFTSVVVCDFEYEVADGELPRVLCMVAEVLDENLKHVRTIKLWRGEFGAAPPFNTGPHTLFVAYSAWAEMQCFLTLGWKFPTHIFDQHTAYLAASNVLLAYAPDEIRTKPRKRLADACQAYDLEGWRGIDKEDIAPAVGAGTWPGKYTPEEILAYCAEDVRMEARLLRAQLRGRGRLQPADTERVIWWSNYSAKAIAQIQARGMPIDVPLWNLVQENKAAVIDELLRRFDPSHGDDDPIYDRDGKWAYDRFEQWLVRNKVAAWPRLSSGQLDTDKDAFALMSHVPGVAALYALRGSVGFIANARLPIGRDGRNRPSLFPFGTATGRNAHTRSPFNAHAGMRSFMLFEPDTIGCYLDWRSQEIGIAAVLSDDGALKADYAAGDINHALAVMLGLTDELNPVRWKEQDPAQRERMKTVQFGIGYGMGVPSLARRLNRHPLIANEVIERHKRRYPNFWQWRNDAVEAAMLDRRIESVFGWPLRLSTKPNLRTLYNFPMQAGGADMLRLATVRLCEAGIVPVMLIHDGILLEETDAETIDLAKEIMASAGRDVCDGFNIGVGVDQMLVGGARYRDKRPMATKMWSTIMEALQVVGALPGEAS